jgi:cytochrome c oxidase accessory protein FixG
MVNITDKSAGDVYSHDDEFRNSIATVDEKGKRIWVYPKKPSGYYHRLRIVVTVVLLSILFAGPFIRIGGQPLLLLNIFERKFVIFGQVFWPQDFVLLALVLIIFFVFIILFTVVFGRIWCGWMCPQTLFMEMVFRKIEYWIEGDANAQRRLNKEPWTAMKIGKKGLKQAIFLFISILIAHTAMAYLIGTDQLFEIVRHSPLEYPAGFAGLAGFTVVFYSVFAYFREQACIAICPYGRLQGVLLGKESIVVAYDWLRGEPRGKLHKTSAPVAVKGDCVDCKLCVHVCPTGIDIRNGTQLECVNCTACIDACDEVMIKVNKPTGLIRFASYNSIQNGIQKLISPRVIGYTVILASLLGILSFSLLTRTEVETTVFKVPGTLYQVNETGGVTNLFNIEFVNKTFEDLPLELNVIDPPYATVIRPDNKPIIVPGESMMKIICFIELPADKIHESRTIITLGVFQGGKKIETLKVKFIGPIKSKL